MRFWQFAWMLLALLAIINLGDIWSAIQAPDWYSYATILIALVMQTYLIVELEKVRDE